MDKAIGNNRAGEFVIAKTDDGYRVFSPLTPANQFIVRDTGDDITCTCPEFSNHRDDPEWRCEHIAAVLEKFSSGRALTAQNGNSEPAKKTKAATAQMLLKRSVSPDGKIDTLSFEFSCDVAKTSREEVKARAEAMLGIQSEVIAGFLKANAPRNGNGHVAPAADGSMAATILNAAGMDTRRGRRLFLNIAVNGQVSKLFGTAKELEEALATAGIQNVAISENQQFNVPCRITMKPSPDGKYQNIDRILPTAGGRP